MVARRWPARPSTSTYDFARHTRAEATVRVADVILVDLLIFDAAPPAVRRQGLRGRRTTPLYPPDAAGRDRRGRSVNDRGAVPRRCVRCTEFVDPRRYADIIVPEGPEHHRHQMLEARVAAKLTADAPGGFDRQVGSPAAGRTILGARIPPQGD
jgi:hypothetical protein